jgi:hypothetical protein
MNNRRVPALFLWRIRFFAFLIFFLILLPKVSGQSIWVDWKGRTWTIGSDGFVQAFKYNFGQGPRYFTMAGSTIPILSPDPKLIAFTRNNDLWLLNLKSMKATRATRVGQPQTREFASVYVLISLWSRDGRKILYQVEQGPTEDLEGATPALKPRKVSYGPFIYDVDGGTSSPVLVPGAVRAWLLGGDFVVKTGDFYHCCPVKSRTESIGSDH